MSYVEALLKRLNEELAGRWHHGETGKENREEAEESVEASGLGEEVEDEYGNTRRDVGEMNHGCCPGRLS